VGRAPTAASTSPRTLTIQPRLERPACARNASLLILQQSCGATRQQPRHPDRQHTNRIQPLADFFFPGRLLACENERHSSGHRTRHPSVSFSFFFLFLLSPAGPAALPPPPPPGHQTPPTTTTARGTNRHRTRPAHRAVIHRAFFRLSPRWLARPRPMVAGGAPRGFPPGARPPKATARRKGAPFFLCPPPPFLPPSPSKPPPASPANSRSFPFPPAASTHASGVVLASAPPATSLLKHSFRAPLRRPPQTTLPYSCFESLTCVPRPPDPLRVRTLLH